jgi:hypothetical protein
LIQQITAVQLQQQELVFTLRVFGCLPGTSAWGCTEAGVRKASREETAGEFARRWCQSMGIWRRCLI